MTTLSLHWLQSVVGYLCVEAENTQRNRSQDWVVEASTNFGPSRDIIRVFCVFTLHQ